MLSNPTTPVAASVVTSTTIWKAKISLKVLKFKQIFVFYYKKFAYNFKLQLMLNLMLYFQLLLTRFICSLQVTRFLYAKCLLEPESTLDSSETMGIGKIWKCQVLSFTSRLAFHNRFLGKVLKWKKTKLRNARFSPDASKLQLSISITKYFLQRKLKKRGLPAFG